MPKTKKTSLPQFSNYVETAKAINLKTSEIWLSVGAYSYMIESVIGGDRGNDTDQEEHHLVVYRGSKQLLSSSRCKLPVIYRLDEIQNLLLPNSAKRLG